VRPSWELRGDEARWWEWWVWWTPDACPVVARCGVLSLVLPSGTLIIIKRP
jgi:hypothetical protein